MAYIPYGKQSINAQDLKNVIDVLLSDWLTQGPMIEQFEKIVADYCGAKYAVAVNSATAALHIACLASELGPDDIMYTSPNTFVASANCARYCGATVDFVDIDKKTYNMSVEELKKRLALAETVGKLPKVVIPVHFSGQSCDMEDIFELAGKYGFKVIEDASHAIGGSYKESKIGSCLYSDMTVFSFHPVKIVTTGEGGMVLTNNPDLYQKLLLFRSHGITRNEAYMQGLSHGPWYYQQIDLGYNYRITDLQSALGVSQMSRIDGFVQKRHKIAQRYNSRLNKLPLIIPYQNPVCYSAYHLYVIRLMLDKIELTHRQVFERLRDVGIGVNLHYIPVHTQPYYQKLGFQEGDFPVAEQYYREALSLPMYYDLTEDEQEYVIQKIEEILA